MPLPIKVNDPELIRISDRVKLRVQGEQSILKRLQHARLTGRSPVGVSIIPHTDDLAAKLHDAASRRSEEMVVLNTNLLEAGFWAGADIDIDGYHYRVSERYLGVAMLGPVEDDDDCDAIDLALTRALADDAEPDLADDRREYARMAHYYGRI